jgi:hypothetical protein
MSIFSDNLPKLPVERLALLQKTLPVAAQTAGPARPAGTQGDEPEIAPAFVAGDSVVRLRGPWRFRTGDDSRYAARDFDDEAWETIPVPLTWEQAGHPDYDGHAWYRTRFTLPAQPDARQLAALWLELGKLDDVDETFVNGTRIGEMAGWRTYRRYAVPAAELNWGGENVLAVHVTDTGGPGGFWSVTRDRPASTWIVEGAPRWWTLAFVNWDDEPRAVSQNLAALGISGPRFAAYDVWAERPMADAQQTLAATIAPHTTLTVALRSTATRPQIIGSTRHIVQGVVDIAEERWDAAARALHGKSVNLDGRPYAITIAVPRGLRPRSCKSDVACTLTRLESDHAVIAWPAGTTADLEWTVTFGPAARR